MPAPHADSFRRRFGRGTVLAAALVASVTLAGCGDRFGPGSQAPTDSGEAVAATSPEAPPLPPPSTATTPVATTPTTPVAVAEPALGEVTNLGGVIWQPRAIYDGAVQIGVRDGYLAAIVPNGAVGQLQVSSDGTAPAAAQGAGPVPSWGRPHVGSDLSGRIVVTYPRCEDPAAVGTCDIYQWTAETKREVVLRAVSGTALAETEAVMDVGDVLVVREKRPVLTADELRYETPPLTTLLHKPRGRPLKVVTRHGGRQIDLRGSRIADILTLPGRSTKSCADTAARALNLTGLTVASREVKCWTGGTTDGFVYASGPSVADNHLRFAITQLNEPGTALDHDLATGKTRSARLTLPVEWWTADGQRSGYGLDTVGGAGMCSPVKADLPTASRCRIVRSAKLVWKPIVTKWKVAAGDPPVRD